MNTDTGIAIAQTVFVFSNLLVLCRKKARMPRKFVLVLTGTYVFLTLVLLEGRFWQSAFMSGMGVTFNALIAIFKTERGT